jgi:hypothetical protein
MRIAVALLLLAAVPVSEAADKPRDLQAEMVKVEHEYFALYNQRNTDNQYDMVCRKNMLDVLQNSPELQALGKKRDELQARYDVATKGTSGH